MKKYLRDNGLSLVLIALFFIFLIGQALSGWQNYNEENREHGRPAVTLAGYLGTGAFGEAVFENWESEFLQMALYVLLTAFLFQRGSAESKDPDENEEEGHEPGKDAPGPVREGGVWLVLYEYSLFLAFLFLFLFSFSGHAYFGWLAANEEAAEHGWPLRSIWGYMTSSQFWFESFQNWQSEFLAIFCIVVLSIWLRQKGSPESKAVSAPHSQTG